MSKEIYISTTPHETRLAIVEDEQLAEIYYERENEYTLAGSIYNGKVTRVLPGMQSSFVDIGLERDAFLYVTDFMEEQGDAADFETDGGSRRAAPREAGSRDEGRRDEPRRDEPRREEVRRDEPRREEVRRDDGSRGARDRGRRGRREATEPVQETTSFDEPIAPAPIEDSAAAHDNQVALDEQGSRRWRGRRGRRRGRGGREGSNAEVATGTYAEQVEPELVGNGETIVLEGSSEDEDFPDAGVSANGTITIDLESAAEPENLGRRNVHRPGRMGRPGSEERAARQTQTEEREPRRRDDRGRGDRRDFGSRDRETEYVPAGAAVTTLPGESIRKYRDPAEVAAEDAAHKAAAPRAPEPVASSRPSLEISGWNGEATLPGESISRYRKPSRPVRTEAQKWARTEVASGDAEDGTSVAGSAEEPVVEASNRARVQEIAAAVVAEDIAPTPVPDQQAEVAAAAAPEETGGLTQHPAHAYEHAAVSPEVIPEPQSIVDAAKEDVPVPSAGEYEPVEGEAASFGENSRRDLRRREQRSEPAAQATDAAIAPVAADTAVEHSQDQVAPDASREESRGDESSGGLISLFGAAGVPGPVESAGVSAASTEPVVSTEPVITTEPVISDADVAVAHEFTSIQPDGAMLPEPAQDEAAEAPHDEVVEASESRIYDETDLTPAELSGSEPVPQVHAYGEGDFHEEEVDGDEYEYEMAVAATDEDESDEYEEETLEGTADLGAMLQEMSIDERTLPEEDEDEELEAAPDAGGFTVDDFGGEPDEEEQEQTNGNAPATGGDRRERRDNRRGGRDRGVRGERPFRGGAGADRGRGRGRQSVQTMDLPAITDLLKPGQEVLVQIAKEPIAKKGARITSHIALPGRFLVFMPTVNHTGVSRKISSDEERRRLKSILLSEKGEQQGGFIVRTAADGASEEELRNDLRFLIQLWQDIKMRSETSKSPALIYHDLGLIERILRDQVTDNFSAIWVDSEQEYERVLRFLQRFQPSLVRRVKLYTKETPLFEHFGVTTEIDKALKSKVWLKSGGSIVINQTEALVAIDINTGKYVGKTARLEDTILKTNLDAIPEIVRQIRLRDLGGIIVIDFIDMDERKNRAKVMQALEDELKTDRAPSKVLPFNDFGLVIMTRKRVKQSLERTLCIPDPVTEGTGMIKSPITVANEIYVETRKMYRHIDKADMMLRVHPEVVKQLKSNGARRLQELEEMTHKTILLKSDPSLSPEQFDIH
ncbi:Rne/Rng family ribonuclease [Terriglobus sp.]|uniref:Rne/Rng family ribonuclease n=1 Tax=Terriglobus sp. TaxID=1889013 RepID=UPI003B003DAC